MNWNEQGGGAFPMTDATGVIEHGMSLRDWFAGQALEGLCASPHNRVAEGYHEDFTDHAYKLADAMLAARLRK